MTGVADLHARYYECGLWTEERIGWLLNSGARRWGDREFINFEGSRYSFNALNHWVIAAAHELIAHGVKPGDKVLLHLGNSMELIVLQLAAWRIGVISVPVIPIYRVHELTAIIAETKPALIASSYRSGTRQPYVEVDEILAAAKGYAPLAKILVGGDDAKAGWRSLCPFPEDQPVSDAGLPAPAPAEACCTILFTSGTTSLPKGAMLNSRALLANIQTWRLGLGLSSRDTAFSGAPLAHIGALFSAFLVPLGIGAKTTIMAAWNPDRAVELIQQEKATFMAGARVFLQDLIERYEKGMAPDHRIKIFGSGGAPTPPALIERADKVGIYAIRIYGMTETAGTHTISEMGSSLEKRANFDGQVIFGADLEIVDDDNNVLPYGEPGHIRIRTPQLMLGYTDAEANKRQINAEGWFYPGDVGTVTADGWLTMTGRTKDIINRGGEKFSCQDIEWALLSFAEIGAVAVVGLQDPRFGEVVAAFLTLKEGVTWTGPEKILAHLESMRLARQKFPVRWYVLDSLPMSASGKLQKHKLVDLAEQRGPDAVSGN